MSRRSRNLPIEVQDSSGTPAPVQGPMTYTPTDDLLRLRAEYFALCEANPLDTRDVVAKVSSYFPQAKAAQVLRLMEANPAFMSWFQADHEFSAKIKYLADKALVALENVLQNDHPAAQGARVKAAQFIVAMAGQKPKDPEDSKRSLDSALKGLSKAELQAMLGNGTEVKVSVTRPETINIEKEDPDGD